MPMWDGDDGVMTKETVEAAIRKVEEAVEEICGYASRNPEVWAAFAALRAIINETERT